MKVWCVFGGIKHNYDGDVEDWHNDEFELEKIFSSKEGAERYIKSIEIQLGYMDGTIAPPICFEYDEEFDVYSSSGFEEIYFIKEMEVEE